MDFLVTFTESIHPSCAITAVVPFLIFTHQWKQAYLLAFIFSCSDMTNAILKVTARGNRPYWSDKGTLAFFRVKNKIIIF